MRRGGPLGDQARTLFGALEVGVVGPVVAPVGVLAVAVVTFTRRRGACVTGRGIHSSAGSSRPLLQRGGPCGHRRPLRSAGWRFVISRSSVRVRPPAPNSSDNQTLSRFSQGRGNTGVTPVTRGRAGPQDPARHPLPPVSRRVAGTDRGHLRPAGRHSPAGAEKRSCSETTMAGETATTMIDSN